MATSFEHQTRSEPDGPAAGPGQFTVAALEADAEAARRFDQRPTQFLAPYGEDENLLMLDALIDGIRREKRLQLWLDIEAGRQYPGPRQEVIAMLNARRAELREDDQ
jgi:hypothetical protein